MRGAIVGGGVVSAPNWLTSTRYTSSARKPLIHAVSDGRPLCGTYGVQNWRSPWPGEWRCYRCVVATSPRVVTCQDMVSTGITYRQMDYWTGNGWLRCTKQAEGSGSQRQYARSELEVAAVMARLTAAGVTPVAAERVARTGFLADGVRVLVTDPVDIEAVA